MTLDSKTHSNKLDQLKNTNQKSSGKNLLLSKSTLKSKFFIFLTSGILLSLFFVNFTASSLKSLDNIQNNLPTLITSISNLLDNNSNSAENTLYEIKADLLKSLGPINKLLLTEKIVEKDIDKVSELAKIWVQSLDALKQYSLTPQGFQNSLSNQTFTADLEIFFTRLPLLIEETEALYNNFYHYRVFVNTFGDREQKNLLKSFKEAIKLLKIINQNQQPILELLGHYTTKQIVIFNQNTGEARSTGGFYGSYLPISISQGVLNIGQSQSIYYIDGSKDTLNVPHPAYSYYSFGRDVVPVIGARDLNFTPCFPVTARLIEQEFSSSSNGYTIDHLVMANPALIQSILPDNFVLNIPGVSVINKDNFLSEVERLTSLGVQNSRNPKYQISNIFKSILEGLSDIISQQGGAVFINKIIDSIQSRDIQTWFKDPQINKLFETLGLASNQVCDQKERGVITPILMNFSGDKRNLVSDNNFSISREKKFGRVDFTIKYQEYIPPKTFLQRGFNEQTGQSFVGLQLPTSSTNFSVSGSDIISRSLVRQFNTISAQEQNQKPVKTLPEIEIINLTSRNIPGGFTYTQYDGSTVLGTFISSKAGFNEVSLNFSLPISTYESITFYGQPGINNPAIILGEGVRSVVSPNQIYFNEPQFIQKGIDLYVH